MASLNAFANHMVSMVAFSSQNHLFVFSYRTGKLCFDYEHKAEKMTSEENQNNETEKNGNEEVDHYIVKCRFSSKGNFFSICTSDKVILVWNTSSWNLVLKKKMPKKPVRIVFTNAEDFILVADKTGDVYRISLSSQKCEFLLGHLSVILDMKLSRDNKMLITSDRDKKIRFSSYPNCYNIDKFLLAHANFVSCLDVCMHGKFLVTGGGDGKVLLWDCSSGQICDSARFSEKEVAIPRALCIMDNMDVIVIAEKLMEVGCFKIENGRLKKTGRIELSSLPLDVAIVDDDVVVLQKSKKDILTHLRADNGGQYRQLSASDVLYLSKLEDISGIKEPLDEAHWNCDSWRPQ